jgi:aminopeptidase N
MDSPGVKATYAATVTCPAWCTVLMSALNESQTSEVLPNGDVAKIFTFRQPVPTSAYLIALAAGRLESRGYYYMSS